MVKLTDNLNETHFYDIYCKSCNEAISISKKIFEQYYDTIFVVKSEACLA